MQLIFLLSPILYEKQNLGHLAWTADFNPFFQILSPLRQSLLHGKLILGPSLLILAVNGIGIWIALQQLHQQRRSLPFLI